MIAQIIAANHLATGTVVYLNQLFDWAMDISEARILTSESEASDVWQIIKRAKINRDVRQVRTIDIQDSNSLQATREIEFREQFGAGTEAA